MNQDTTSSIRGMKEQQPHSAMITTDRQVGGPPAGAADFHQYGRSKEDKVVPSAERSRIVPIKKTGAGRYHPQTHKLALQHILQQQSRANQFIKARLGGVSTSSDEALPESSLSELDSFVSSSHKLKRFSPKGGNAISSHTASLEDLFDLFVWNASGNGDDHGGDTLGETTDSNIQISPSSPVRLLPCNSSSILRHPSSAPGGCPTRKLYGKTVTAQDRASMSSFLSLENGNTEEERTKAANKITSTSTSTKRSAETCSSRAQKLLRRRVEILSLSSSSKGQNKTPTTPTKKAFHSSPLREEDDRTTDRRLSVSEPSTPRITTTSLLVTDDDDTRRCRPHPSSSSSAEEHWVVGTNDGRRTMDVSIHPSTPRCQDDMMIRRRIKPVAILKSPSSAPTRGGRSKSASLPLPKTVTFDDHPQIFMPTLESDINASSWLVNCKRRKNQSSKRHGTVRLS